MASATIEFPAPDSTVVDAFLARLGVNGGHPLRDGHDYEALERDDESERGPADVGKDEP